MYIKEVDHKNSFHEKVEKVRDIVDLLVCGEKEKHRLL